MFEQAKWPLFERNWRIVCCLFFASWRECQNIWTKEWRALHSCYRAS